MLPKKKKSIKNVSARALACAAAFCAAFLPFFGQFSAVTNADAAGATEINPTAASRFAAAQQTARQNAQNESLYLPGSYEQYLPLENPASVAVSENYTAISDGLTIYVYNRLAQKYTQYNHGAASDQKITQIRFDNRERLFFSTQTAKLFMLSQNFETASLTGVRSCSSFEIADDTLYYTIAASGAISIYSQPLEALGEAENNPLQTLNDDNHIPALAYNGESVYYTYKGEFLYSLDGARKPSLTGGAATVLSMTFAEDYCYFTDTDLKLYAYRYTDDSAVPEQLGAGETFVSVNASSAGNSVYAVGNRKIRQIDSETRAFTSFEISASSNSDGRLYNAVDTALAGNTLFTLDSGNPAENVGARVLLTPALAYGAAAAEENGKTATLPLSQSYAKYIAADDATFLIATAPDSARTPAAAGVLALYDTAGNLLQTFEAADGESFTGVTNVYGTYYAASKNYLYKIEKTVTPAEDGAETAAYTILSGKTTRSNRLLTSDVYGTLYYVQAQHVYTCTEEELSAAFSSDDAFGKPAEEAVALLPDETSSADQTTKILVDFHRNVYALHGGTLTKCAKSAEDTAEDYDMKTKTLAYTQSESTPVVSAAFGVETETAYVLYNGNFIAATYDLPLPTVNTIAVDGTDETLFAEENASFTVVECAEKSLLIRFDVASLKGATYFPYLSYARASEKTPAISMGETEKYYLLAVYDKENNDYYTALAEKQFCAAVSEEEFLTPPPAEYAGGATGYVTNALPLYKYPYLTDLITACPLARGAAVRVLKTVEKLDWKYYQVEYTDETGATKTGFLPAAYVTDTNGNVPEAETTTLGGENNNSDLVWRLVYIVLGTLVICILVDYLILRRNDKS